MGLRIGIQVFDLKRIKETMGHWRSSHYAITHVRNKSINIQGKSPTAQYVN